MSFEDDFLEQRRKLRGKIPVQLRFDFMNDLKSIRFVWSEE